MWGLGFRGQGLGFSVQGRHKKIYRNERNLRDPRDMGLQRDSKGP